MNTQVTDDANGSPVSLVQFIDEQATRERITIQVASSLTAGRKYKITMKFISILNALLAGFYRSSYVENGQTKYSTLSGIFIDHDISPPPFHLN